MLPSGHLLRYTVTKTGITVQIQSLTEPVRVYNYHFADTKHGEQTLRRWLNKITLQKINRTFSSKMTNLQVMDAIIMANQMKGLIE